MKKYQLLFSVLLVCGFMTATPKAKAQTPSNGWFVQVDTSVFNFGDFWTLAPVDINNDDYPDYVANYTPPGADIYHQLRPFKILLNVADPNNPGGRKFIDVTPQHNDINRLAPDTTGYNANIYTLVDVNNDGNVDLITAAFIYTMYGQYAYPYPDNRCHLFLGDGTGKFTYQPNSGLASIGLVNARTITALDYDRDGNIDLYVSTAFKEYNASSHVATFDHGYLFKGNGDGTFTDVTASSGLADKLEPVYSSAVMDFNNDCNPDIFTAPYCRTGGSVWENDGNGHFKDVAADVGYDLYKIGANQQACTFTLTPEDVNGDGDMDMFIAEVHGGNLAGQFRSTIAINEGASDNYKFDIDPTLLPPTASYSRGDYDGSFLDFENDGIIDLVMAQGGYAPNPNQTYFYRQHADHTWEDVTQALGLRIPELDYTKGCEPIDFDLDGDDDIMIVDDKGRKAMLWENKIGSQNNWIGVKLDPTVSGVNKDAVGARVYVFYDGKMHMRTITVGRGMHMGQQPLILNFGLGKTDKVDSIAVRWPDKNCGWTKIYDPAINQIVTISNTSTGIAERKPETAVKVFPNPAQGYVVLQREGIAQQTADFSLMDLSGRTIAVPHFKSDSDKLIFNLSSLPAGIYVAKVTLKNGQVIAEKVVKN